MNKTCRNIYLKARLDSGLEQKNAAEQLACSPATLRAYESGAWLPADDTVAAMMIVYQADWLGYIHLLRGPIGQRILPKVATDKGVAACALAALNASNNLVSAIKELVEIAADDVILAENEAKFLTVCKKLKLVIGAIMTMVLVEYRKRPDALARNRS